MKHIICSFANESFSQSLKRLECQIEKISFFNQYYLLNENNLDEEFRSRFKEILIDGTRGYGFWVWKPYIIKKIFEKIDDGDTLLYIDAGCHINHHGKKRLLKYYDLLEKSKNGIIAFQLPFNLCSYSILKKKLIIKDYFIEQHWTKGDLLDYFNVRKDHKLINSPQILSGIILMKKNKETVSLITQWLNVYETNLKLIDDSPSSSCNLKGFIQNRHDQSSFSILCKLYNVDLLSTEEVEAEPAIINNHPILAIRDIGNRMPYSSFNLLRFTRILKSPYLFFKGLIDCEPKIINK